MESTISLFFSSSSPKASFNFFSASCLKRTSLLNARLRKTIVVIKPTTPIINIETAPGQWRYLNSTNKKMRMREARSAKLKMTCLVVKICLRFSYLYFMIRGKKKKKNKREEGRWQHQHLHLASVGFKKSTY